MQRRVAASFLLLDDRRWPIRSDQCLRLTVSLEKLSEPHVAAVLLRRRRPLLLLQVRRTLPLLRWISLEMKEMIGAVADRKNLDGFPQILEQILPDGHLSEPIRQRKGHGVLEAASAEVGGVVEDVGEIRGRLLLPGCAAATDCIAAARCCYRQSGLSFLAGGVSARANTAATGSDVTGDRCRVDRIVLGRSCCQSQSEKILFLKPQDHRSIRDLS
ncbi:hypothetical protein ACLOJK_024243 [Asimina triloba]